ncbi:MAG: carboxypeptidase-like regulatory domain-containing protein [bacterium]
MTVRSTLLVACAMAITPLHSAMAQQTDSSAAPGRAVRFTGTIASILTTRPVSLADVRLIYIDSATADKSDPRELGEVFVDSAKSRVGLTDTSGAFVIRNVMPGHYLINVRRIGFEPFEGVLTIDTLPVEMELTLNQIAQVLPPVTISTSAVNRVTEKLDRMGFTNRSHMGTSGRFVDRPEILRRKAQFVTDVLQAYGVARDAVITIDRMDADWDMLSDYPMDLVIGIEIYKRRGSLPTEFDRTRRGSLAMGANGTGGVAQHTVLIWTYIP